MMNPLDYKVRADPRRRGDSIDWGQGVARPGLQIIFTLLFVNRGRRLSGVIDDASDYEIKPMDVIKGVHKLLDLGVVELNDNVLFLPLRPRTVLDRLGSIR